MLLPFVGVPWALADENAAANKIFVETVQILHQAAAAKPAEAIQLYEHAIGNLDRIVAEFPSSNLAVQIASGQTIGQVSRAGIQKMLGKAKCYHSPGATCVLAQATEMVREGGDAARAPSPETLRVDPFRIRTLTAIAGAQARVGSVEEARKILADILEAARSLKSDVTRGWLLAAIAEAQAKAGDSAAALEIARSIKDDLWRTEAHRAVVESQARAGDISGALETARGMREDLWRARAWRAIAEAQAKAGDTRTALETARGIKHDVTRVEGLSHIARLQAKTGDISEANKLLVEALETARAIKDDAARVTALIAIARAQAKTEDGREAGKILAEALETSHSVKDDFSRTGSLSGITEFQARTGHVYDALETARRIEHDHFRAWALAILSELLGDMGLK
jgi:tetratricopeptide (TPR) repeat protein